MAPSDMRSNALGSANAFKHFFQSHMQHAIVNCKDTIIAIQTWFLAVVVAHAPCHQTCNPSLTKTGTIALFPGSRWTMFFFYYLNGTEDSSDSVAGLVV